MPENNSQDSGFQYRRLPATPRKIAEINPEKDIRARLLGHVIDKTETSLIIDDGSGKSEVIIEEGTEKFNINDFLRIFVRVLPLENGFELRGEVVQNMNNLDTELYKKVYGE